jgi:hypothetical protein
MAILPLGNNRIKQKNLNLWPIFSTSLSLTLFCVAFRQFFAQKKGWSQLTTLNVSMRKYKVLRLGLQLSFPIATDICNSWYLYGLEC